MLFVGVCVCLTIFTVFLKKFGIGAKFVTSTDPADFEKAIDENTKALYVESIGNPKYIVADLPRLSKIAHAHKIPLIVDNTFGMGGTCFFALRRTKELSEVVTLRLPCAPN